MPRTSWLLHLEDFDGFTARRNHFLVYGPSSSRVLGWLRRAGAVLVLRAEDPDTQRFGMSRPGPYSLFEVTIERNAPPDVQPGS